MMFIHEQIALQMAKARLDDAIREAERTRAARVARIGVSARIRLGKTLVRLGRWLIGYVPPPQPTSSDCV